jgi:hypothetical protein
MWPNLKRGMLSSPALFVSIKPSSVHQIDGYALTVDIRRCQLLHGQHAKLPATDDQMFWSPRSPDSRRKAAIG